MLDAASLIIGSLFGMSQNLGQEQAKSLVVALGDRQEVLSLVPGENR